MTTRCHLFKSIRVIMETVNGKQVCLKKPPFQLPSHVLTHTQVQKHHAGFYSLQNADTYGQKRTDLHIQCLYRKGWGLKEIQSDQNKPRNLKRFPSYKYKGLLLHLNRAPEERHTRQAKPVYSHVQSEMGDEVSIICTLLGNNYFSHCLSIYQGPCYTLSYTGCFNS